MRRKYLKVGIMFKLDVVDNPVTRSWNLHGKRVSAMLRAREGSIGIVNKRWPDGYIDFACHITPDSLGMYWDDDLRRYYRYIPECTCKACVGR